MRQVKLQTPIADCLKLFLLTLLDLLSVKDSYATKQFQMLNIFLPTLICLICTPNFWFVNVMSIRHKCPLVHVCQIWFDLVISLPTFLNNIMNV